MNRINGIEVAEGVEGIESVEGVESVDERIASRPIGERYTRVSGRTS